MLIYYLYAAFIIVLAFFCGLVNNCKSKKVFIIIFFITSFLLMGLRSRNIGIDTKLYINIFESIGAKGSAYLTENDSKGMYIYYLYNRILYWIWPNGNMLIIGNAFVITLLSTIFIYRFCDKSMYVSAVLYVLMYFYFTSFNTSRQCIAVLLVAIGVTYLFKKQFWGYAVFQTIAIFVHLTSIVGIAFLILYLIPKTNKTLIFVIICAFVASFFLTTFGDKFIELFDDYSGYINFKNNTSQGRTIYLVIFNAIIFVLIYIFEFKNLNENENLVFLMMIISCYISMGAIGASIIMIDRVAQYFYIFFIAFVPYLFNDRFSEKLDLTISSGVVAIYLVLFVILVSGNYSGIIAYSTWF